MRYAGTGKLLFALENPNWPYYHFNLQALKQQPSLSQDVFTKMSGKEIAE